MARSGPAFGLSLLPFGEDRRFARQLRLLAKLFREIGHAVLQRYLRSESKRLKLRYIRDEAVAVLRYLWNLADARFAAGRSGDDLYQLSHRDLLARSYVVNLS